MEAERLALLHRIRALVDRQEISELAAQQRLGLRLEILGELARNVGQCAERIGLPEPAAAAVFELIDEVEGLLGLPLQRQSRTAGKQRLLGDEDAVDDHEHREDVDGERDRAIA